MNFNFMSDNKSGQEQVNSLWFVVLTNHLVGREQIKLQSKTTNVAGGNAIV